MIEFPLNKYICDVCDGYVESREYPRKWNKVSLIFDGVKVFGDGSYKKFDVCSECNPRFDVSFDSEPGYWSRLFKFVWKNK